MSDFDDEDESDELSPDEKSSQEEEEEVVQDSEESEKDDGEMKSKQDDEEEEEEEEEDESDEKVYYPIDIFQRRRFFKGYNHPPIDNFWCWCHPRNLPCCCNDMFLRGSKSTWYFFIKCIGLLELHALNITIFINFVGYILFVFLVSFTGYTKLYDSTILPVYPYVYYGLIPQFICICIVPPISFFLKFLPLYYVCDEYRRQFIRWGQYFFFSYFINAYTVLSASGFFGSLGVFKLIRCVLYFFNRGENIELEFAFYMVMLVLNLIVVVGYTISFFANVWVTTGFFCMLFTVFERPYSSKPYDPLGDEEEDEGGDNEEKL